ncbi:hypothetical protein [Bacillus sp. 1P06AnD]|uniref:hypothetical protein n=1 Tax=Bacillus sp. 1P06AnD TaxID=3132208 RepID=UPI0039A05AF4
MNIEMLEQHKKLIVKELMLENVPPVLYKEEAVQFLKEHVDKYKYSIPKGLQGYFCYENIPDLFKETGVVCIIKGKNPIGTIAHELCHAKQYENHNAWLHMGPMKKALYYWGYYFYPAEIEANSYAGKYLKSVNRKLFIRFKVSRIKVFLSTKIIMLLILGLLMAATLKIIISM